MDYFADTIAAPATPSGVSALAVIRVSGPLVSRVVEEVFGSNPPTRRTTHSDYRDRNNQIVDDVLFATFQNPSSYTGEDVLEISCHGNPFIISKILDDLFARGCRPAEPGEFTKRSFLNGRIDLSQAEAVADLICARSDRALAAANQQLRGALGRQLQPMTQLLLELLARVEAYIDFPEEDLPVDDRSILTVGIQRLLGDSRRLLATDRYGELLRHGIKTVILGEPNAGKSSLFNRLLGRERALVSAEPGTTRDYLEEAVNLGPHCIRLIDTAGLNSAPTTLERAGITKTVERVHEADLFLLVYDVTRPAPPLPVEVSSRLTPQNSLLVLNKTDLDPKGFRPVCPDGVIRLEVSALTGSGCDELVNAVKKLADGIGIDLGEDLVAINSRHALVLSDSIRSLESAAAMLDSGSRADELLASELRNVLNSLGEISGKIDDERVLDELFSRFCIGK